MSDHDAKAAQIELANSLQLKWLKHMDKLFDDGTITSTDLATLARLLMSNGWSLDPHTIPQRLKDKLVKSDPSLLDDSDADVIGRIA